MRVALLSFPDVLPAAHRAYVASAAARPGMDLLEVAPDRLRLALPDGTVLVGAEPLDVDAVVHRTVHPYRDLVQPVLEALGAAGVRVLNPIPAALLSRSKARTLGVLARAGLPVVPTVVTATVPEILPGWDELVVKPSAGAQGRGVRRATPAALELGRYDATDGPTLVQPHLRGACDLRGYVVGSRCVAVGARHAAPGEWRCNVTLGGRVRPVADAALRAAAEQLCVAAVSVLGLDHAAVDLLLDTDGRPLLSEVDAWGGFTGLAEGLGVDVAGAVLDLAAGR